MILPCRVNRHAIILPKSRPVKKNDANEQLSARSPLMFSK